MKFKSKLTYAIGLVAFTIGALIAIQSPAQAQTTFTSSYEIDIPAGSVGGTAVLSYAYSGSDSLTTCSSPTVNISIPSTAVVRTGSVTLINVPQGTTNSCEYTATISNVPPDLESFTPRTGITASNNDFTTFFRIDNNNSIGNSVVDPNVSSDPS